MSDQYVGIIGRCPAREWQVHEAEGFHGRTEEQWPGPADPRLLPTPPRTSPDIQVYIQNAAMGQRRGRSSIRGSGSEITGLSHGGPRRGRIARST